jgi:hypothetical protein
LREICALKNISVLHHFASFCLVRPMFARPMSEARAGIQS